MTRHPRTPPWALLPLALIAFLAGTPGASRAHLSIIRQGAESASFMAPDERLGYSLAVGDFDGDGYDDLAMGSPGESVSGLADAGAVIVSFGSPNGITHVGARFITASSLGQASQAGAQFGFAVHAADLNDDGKSDLLIGAPYEDVAGQANAGRFYFVFGSASGPSSVGTPFDQTHCGDVREAGDAFGYSFATANFDGDPSGFLDLAVGSPGEDNSGAVAINFLGGFFGPSTGSAALVRQSDLGGTNNALDGFGKALAAGNLMGSSHAELATGAPDDDVLGSADAGRVWVLQGTSAGLTTGAALSYTADNKDFRQISGRFGSALAVGHFFTGGFQSLAIGEPGRTLNGLVNAGRVVVAKGLLTGLDFIGDNGRILTEDSGGSGAVQIGDRFGSAIAAGEYSSDDSYDDLGIGAPGDGLGVTANAGQFQIFPGGHSGPTGAGWSGFNQGTCNDPVASGDQFGWSVAFGRFDSSNRGGFAVGAPYEDDGFAFFTSPDAGQVHVIAPWRQVFGLASKTAFMGDCFGTPLFSVRPFDPVLIASTTKIMTVLLAIEHIAAGLDPNTTYTVPLWVSSDIFVNGSQCDPELVMGETLTLNDLMHMCLRFSGNDAAFAIADLVYGGGGQTSFTQYVNNVVAFVNEMNARAASLGMTVTHFTNPPGYDVEKWWLPTGSDHRSSAYDMWLLVKVAIAKPSFGFVCGPSDYITLRQGMSYTVKPGYVGNLPRPPVIGLKDGWTPKASNTGVFAALNTNSTARVVGSLMNSPNQTVHLSEAMLMMNMARTECGEPVLNPDIGPFVLPIANLNTQIDSRHLTGTTFGSSTEDNMECDVIRQSGDGTTSIHLDWGRQSESVVEPGASIPLGIAPFQSHDGFRISNLDTIPHQIRVVSFPVGAPSDFTIEPDSVVVIPPFSTGPIGQIPSYTISVENLGDLPAPLAIMESYGFDIGGIGPADGGPAMRIVMRRSGMARDAMWLRTMGTDPDGDDDSIFVSIHDPGVQIGVGDLPAALSSTVALRLLPAAPNPSRGATRIGFELGRSGSVGMTIHDLQGRVVRRLAERALIPGRRDFVWDGLTDDGRPVKSGLYFYRATLDRGPAGSGTIVMMR